MKNKLIFILWLLMFSFFSCDFGIKENEETNSKEYFTVKGSCSIQGAIPSDLLPKKSIKQNAQRTVVPKIAADVITVSFESETGETKSVEVVDKDGVLNFEVELPVGKWTVKAQGKKSDVVIIKSESCQIELSAENKSANVALVLKPTQSDTVKGSFKFSFGMETHKVSGMKYTYIKNGATELEHTGKINDFSAPINRELSSGVYTFRFDFYSNMECTDELLYSFTEVVNIFDGLTTDTWIGAGEYIKDGKICITDTMINQFISTTVYVSENGNDSNLGTFFAPVRTIQKAVDKVIAMNVVTEPEEGNPYKIFLLSDIETSPDDSFESNNNALVNIDPSSASGIPLYLTISKYGDGDENATINAKRSSSDTGRVMYIGENANVTLKNLILTGGYLLDGNGGGIYSEGNCNLNSCTISGNTAKADSESVSGGGVYIESGSFTMEGCTISDNTAGSETSVANAYGGGIYGANGTIIMNNTTIFENEVASSNGVEGAGVCLHGAILTMNGGLISNNKCSSDSGNGGGVYINNSSTFTMTSGEISDNSAKYGGGVCVSGGNFIMNGGSISKNTADNNGKGVYVVKSNNTEPTFEISGDACITENDVYLANGTTITVTGNLTSTDTVATITPEKYELGIQVLTAESGVTLAEYVGKFAVTTHVPSDGQENWFIDSAGYLVGGSVTEPIKSETGEYEVSSPENLLWIALELKRGSITRFNMKLTNDIEILSGEWQFYQLNVSNSSIDGQGYSITIDEDVSKFGNDAGGLFYKFNDSTVKNLVLKGKITAKTSITVNTTNNTTEVGYIGALCRSAYGSIFENVMSEVTITDNGSGFAGGLIGRLGTSVSYDPTKAMVKNCAVYADISSTKGIAGGILGAIWEVTRCCTIQNSIYMGGIEGTTVGAIVGKNENNDKAESVLNNIWYCVTNNSSIPLIGTKADTTKEDITDVESKTAEDIATDAAATLLNTNSDGTVNDVWEYISDSDYPTLKAFSSE